MSITLKTDSLILTFNRENGAIIDLVAPKTGWQIMRRAELGVPFRMLVPLSDSLRNNPVLGEKQKVTQVLEGADFVTFIYDGVNSERGGKLDIKITVTVRAEGAQAVFYSEIENRSEYMVEDFECPCIGDFNPPTDAQWLKTFSHNYGTSCETMLWPEFTNLKGYHGVDVPTQLGGWDPISAPPAPFKLIRSQNQGLYTGVKNASGDMVATRFELWPGYDDSMHSRVPKTDEIAGKTVFTLFTECHMCYIKSGEKMSLTPIALEAYQGDWQQGVDIYKNWRDTWTKTAVGPDWSNQPHSWLQIHINSPEDELRLRFSELPKVAKECAQYGVRAIQLVGWNDGGQDKGNPSHNPDPRLGTFEELKEAIAECQKLGVKIILFAKFTWADRATEWFRNELIADAIKDPYGDYYVHQGYQYQTPAQLLDFNTRRLIPMCFGSEHYREVCKAEFKKIVDLGADGFLYDECQHHGPAHMCYDESHGHRYGWPVYKNDREFIYGLQQTEGLREDFLFSGEANYDWEFEAYSLAYFRSWSPWHIALSRYLRPDVQIMTGVNGFYDRNMINQCLLFRYIISYEPYNFKGMLSDFPDTVAYGQKMDALRTEYRKHFWDGEYRDTCGGSVTAPDGAEMRYAVYRADDGSEGMVVCNFGEDEITCSPTLDSGSLSRYRLVDGEEWIPLSGKVTLPPRSAAILL